MLFHLEHDYATKSPAILGVESMQSYQYTEISSDPKSLARKPKSKAEAYGQVLTPMAIAVHMLDRLEIGAGPQHLLDPCIGPATFPKALSQSFRDSSNITIDAFDIDKEMIALSMGWERNSSIKIEIKEKDYLLVFNKKKYDCAVLNPPYVRQEWICKKEDYRRYFKENFDISIPGTSNLYVYFIVKVISELKYGGKFSCIVYDSWQNTIYGKWLQEFISKMCVNIEIENVTLPFHWRLIDATIITAKKRSALSARTNSTINFVKESFTSKFDGFDTIDNLFLTRRGLRLKQANFFISNLSQKDKEASALFIKKSSSLDGYIVPDNHEETVLLVNKDHNDARTILALELRLKKALLEPKKNIPILTWFRERPSRWYLHQNSQWAPILFNYYLRKRPKHIFNPNRLFSDNFYGTTPKGKLDPFAWLAILNSTATAISLLEQARNQGSGLAKLQLFEYRKARIVDINKWLPQDVKKLIDLGRDLAASKSNYDKIIIRIDTLIASIHAKDALRQDHLMSVFDEIDKQARKPKEKV